MVIGSVIEIIFFTLYNGCYHPFGRIIESDNDCGNLEEVKSSSWTDKFTFQRIWSKIKNVRNMTADSPRKYCIQSEKNSKSPGIAAFSHNTVVNKEIQQSLGNKNSANMKLFVN